MYIIRDDILWAFGYCATQPSGAKKTMWAKWVDFGVVNAQIIQTVHIIGCASVQSTRIVNPKSGILNWVKRECAASIVL